MPLDYAIATHTLSNGLRVVVNEDRSVPVVAVNIWVGVGSRHEHAGRTGLAHLFEHLMFQGSENVASGEHFAVLMAHGARLNATTWFDRTNYFETVPEGAYELALWMEADRHGRLLSAVTQENLDNQRAVVLEEKSQRYDNVPYGHALHDMYALAFPEDHPYHHPTIGSMADVEAATLADVHDFYRRHYRPSNTVLTLAGDLSADDAFTAVERYFGAIPDIDVPATPLDEPLEPLAAPVRITRTGDVPTDRLYLGFRLPVDHTCEHFAASAALDALAGLSIARLERRLVRDLEWCHTVSAASLGLADNTSLGFVVAEVADGTDVDAVEHVICDELEILGRNGPSVVEMEAVMAQNERSWLSALAGLDERADHTSRMTTLFDDPQGINTMLDRLQALDAGEVATATARWLRPEGRAVVAYTRSAS